MLPTIMLRMMLPGGEVRGDTAVRLPELRAAQVNSMRRKSRGRGGPAAVLHQSYGRFTVLRIASADALAPSISVRNFCKSLAGAFAT